MLEGQGWVCNRSLVIPFGIPKAYRQFCMFLHACAFLLPFVTPMGDSTVGSQCKLDRHIVTPCLHDPLRGIAELRSRYSDHSRALDPQSDHYLEAPSTVNPVCAGTILKSGKVLFQLRDKGWGNWSLY